MPRAARIKQEDFVYHVMVRSISDTKLFKDHEDKDKYLKLIKRYQGKLLFKVYGYCLMTTHGHLIIDSNGADISKIMHRVNQCYAQYFNKRYKRRGHVFQDRFKSIVVDSDDYLITLSAYIHNNPTDIKMYKNCPEKFKYSTLGIYLGLRKDTFGIVDEHFVMSLFSSDVKKAREDYLTMVLGAYDIEMSKKVEFINEKSEYRSERVILRRDSTPKDVSKFLESHLDIDEEILRRKYKKSATEYRAIYVFLVHCYCGYSYKKICEVIGNLTLSRISKLSSLGFELIQSKEEYQNIMVEFLRQRAA